SQQGGAGAGQGQGGAGNNVTTGKADPDPGAFDPNNGHGSGQVVPYEPVFAPSFIGGTGGQTLNPNGNNNSSEGQTTIQVQGPITWASATVPLSDVASQAAGQADAAMDIDHVPGALRGVVRQYFSGLNSPEQP